MNENLQTKTQKSEERKEMIYNIVGTLEQQKLACSVRKMGARDEEEITSNVDGEDEVVEVAKNTAETMEKFTLVQEKDN